MRLVIGNKNYSSWSLRPWLLLQAFQVPFDEHIESLAEPNLAARLLQFSDSARVPVLNDGELTVWDSLAICEYVNDQYLAGKAWPAAPSDKALARAITAEMHSGFAALRTEMPMNCRATRKIELSDLVRADIARIDQIWSTFARADAAGELRLFGQFGIADCFFAPVVMRFLTYQPELSMAAQAYLRSMRAHPSLQSWVDAALRETEVVDDDEAGVDKA